MRRRHDDGQLLLLAGVVLVLAFIATALTLVQINDLERQAAEEQSNLILADYRFMREKVGTTLNDAVGASTNNQTFNDFFKGASGTLKAVMQEKGYDVRIHLASSESALSRDEWSFTQAGWPMRDDGSSPDPDTGDDAQRVIPYHFRSHNNTLNLEQGEGGLVRKWDGTNDGIVWTKPCVKSASGCIQAAIVYLYLADAVASLEEYVVYAFNN